MLNVSTRPAPHNPNKCVNCSYKEVVVENETRNGWCYMFRDEPDTMCNAFKPERDGDFGDTAIDTFLSDFDEDLQNELDAEEPNRDKRFS